MEERRVGLSGGGGAGKAWGRRKYGAREGGWGSAAGAVCLHSTAELCLHDREIYIRAEDIVDDQSSVTTSCSKNCRLLKTQWGLGSGDHVEVVEWLELVCVCANVLRWLS